MLRNQPVGSSILHTGSDIFQRLTSFAFDSKKQTCIVHFHPSADKRCNKNGKKTIIWARIGLSMTMNGNLLFHNRRTHIRYDLQQEIRYRLRHNPAERTSKGIVIDISEAGLGLYTYNPLKEGQELTIMSDLRELNKKGIVRWCHELGESVYRIGLMFI
jgi:hypothetical protein